MVHISQLVLGLLASPISQPNIHDTQEGLSDPSLSKSIAVVGAGSGGLAALDTLLQYSVSNQANWTVTLFEQRPDVGGIWLANEHRSVPPEIPKTSLYPYLRTNTPVPSMTYPGPNHTFPEGTPLYPSYEHVEEYHRRYARKQRLYPHMKLNHTVTATQWIGNSTAGHWALSVTAAGTTMERHFDHLVVAAGNNHFPHMPSWPGQALWLAHGKRREITHSIWFHLAEEYKGAKVLIVGSRSSGVDIATQLASSCEVHMSTRGELERDVDPRVVIRPGITHFTKDAVVFSDNTTYEADVVILCTGYDLRFPFLETKKTLTIEPGSSTPSERLKGNLRYIFPLHEHIFSLDSSYPVTALAFVGLPILVSNCPSDIAQSIYLTRILANPNVLPHRAQLLRELAEREQDLRNRGYDPYYIGHRLVDGYTFDYQDKLIDYLKERGVLAQDGKKFVEEWRREISQMPYLRRGWMRVEELGLEREWLSGVSNESEWASLMRRLNEWEEEQELLEAGA